MTNKYNIYTTEGNINFEGIELPERETNHWIYFEDTDGILMHFRKDHIIMIIKDELPVGTHRDKERLISITTSKGPIDFKGVYLPELSKDSEWHFYADTENMLALSFRKEHMVLVRERDIPKEETVNG